MRRIIILITALIAVITLTGTVFIGTAKAERHLGYFTASWCHYCKQTTPIVNKLKREGTPITVMDVDSEAYKEAARYYNIKVYPSFVIVNVDDNSGVVTEVTRRQGAMSEPQMRAWLTRHGVQPSK